MKSGIVTKFCLSAVALLTAGALSPTRAAAPSVKLVENGRPLAVIRVPSGLMGDDAQLSTEATYAEQRAEAERRRLRESVRDLAHYLQVMSGAELNIETGRNPANDWRLPIYVGDLARDVFGPPARSYPYEQGWRLIASGKGVGLIGESDLAASYALFELLYRLGCRWYMPGDLGECIPRNPTVQLETCDDSSTPSTVYRGLWKPPSFAVLDKGFKVRLNTSEPFTRRNRQGGLPLWATHGLSRYIAKDELEAHPEWHAVINGKRHPHKLIWSKPEVAEAMVRGIVANLERQYQPTICLAPSDGMGWDESEDPAFDTGDWDPIAGKVSKSDRFLMLCNRVADGVTKQYPDVKFPILIYVDYTRPPLREKVHPALIPYLAPITYNRMHPMDWPNHPTGAEQLRLVKGWQNVSENLAYYWYGYNLSETWAPHPMITMWGRDLPILFGKNNQYPYWFPETMANFETSWIGLNLGMRLSWDASQDPDALVAELIDTFYGAAAEPMQAYWHHIDRAWVEAPDYAGAAWGYRRRFTPEVLRQARGFMDAALQACETAMEYRRVALADESLRQFERFMGMEEKLAAGQFRGLDRIFDTWWGVAKSLGQRYRNHSAFYERFGYRFDWITWPHGDVARDAARIESNFTLLTKKPIREWRILADSNSVSETEGWLKPDYDDSAWKTTDTTLDTWSYLGYHNYFGKMVYRTSVAIPKVPDGKRVYLWLSRSAGEMQLFVNGKTVPWRTPEGDPRESYSRYATPTSFDITETIRSGKKNTLGFLCERQGLDELGVGGLLGPVVLYRDN